MNYDLLEFTPKNGCLAIISKILGDNSYSILNCNLREHYESVSDDNNKRFFLSLEEGKLIFKYNSLESKEQNKGVLKKLEQSLLENSIKKY